MIERRLGRTGLMVRIMGLGGHFDDMSRPDITNLVHFALDKGINYIETAPNYGKQPGESESGIGEALQTRRNECFVATKVFSTDPDEVEHHIDRALKRLKTDCIDICQIMLFSEDALSNLEEGSTFTGIQRAQEKGKVRFIGGISHYPAPLVRGIKTGLLDTILVPCNIMRRELAEDPVIALFDFAKRHDVGVTIMKPIAAGRITKNLPEALKFVMANPVTVLIPGATCHEHIETNVAIAEQFSRLSEDERRSYLDEAMLLGKPHCTRCGYCLPCPQNIPIPKILRAGRYCVTFGLKQWYNINLQNIGSNGRIDWEKCHACRLCEDRCPFDIPVLGWLTEGMSFIEGASNPF